MVVSERSSADLLAKTDWRTVRFGEVVRHVKSSVDPETSGLERYVAGEHMATDDLHIRSWGTIGDGYLGPAFHMRFKPGQVLYGSRRTYLRKVAYAEFEGICANTTFVLEPKTDDLLPELLPFIMQTEAFHEYSIRQSRGSVNPYVNFRDIASYEFALPPKDEQRRIAEILWAADAAVQRFNDVGVLLQAGGGSAMEEAYRAAGAAVVPLGSVLTLCQYGLSDRAEKTGRHPILGMVNLREGRVLEETDGHVDLTTDLFAEYAVAPDDILFNRTNSAELVGKVGIYKGDGRHVFASYLVRLRVDPTKADANFVNYALNSVSGQRQIRSYATRGVSQSNVNASNLQKVLIPLPGLDRQRAAVAQIDAIDAKLQAVRSHSEALVSMVRGLTARLMIDGNV